MSQPEWELIRSDDCSALYVDKTSVYPPELTIADEVGDHDDDGVEATAAIVFRFQLNRCWRVTETDDDTGTTTYLTSHDPARAADLPHPLRSYVPWFHDSLGRIAESVGMSVADLTDALCTDDPNHLVIAYEAIGGYHGYDNFCHSPQEWTASEFAAWPERGPRLSSEERDAFTEGYVSCALWCGVVGYVHESGCPCRGRSADGEPYDPATCTCEPELVNCTPCDAAGVEQMDSQLTDDARSTLTADAHAFYASNVADLRASTLDMSQLGHDFWLTRNRHGAGYWDHKVRGAEADAALGRLTEAAHTYGEQTLVEDHTMKVGVL